MEELRALLVDDRDGIVAGLDERMQQSVDSYADPWQEGREPRTSGQFADALPLIPLPQVPVRPAIRGAVGMSAPEITSHRLGPVEAIPLGEGRAFAVGDTQVAVFRLRDGLRATQAVCPHAGGPLADAQADPAKVVCPLHNYAFSVHRRGLPERRLRDPRVPGPRRGRGDRRRPLVTAAVTPS